MYNILQLNEMLVPELREIAERLEVKGYKRLTKKELIYKILDYQAMKGAVPTEEPEVEAVEEVEKVTPKVTKRKPPKAKEEEELTTVVEVSYTQLKSLGLHNVPIVGLAKQQEGIYFPHTQDPLLIPHDKGALKLMQRIRDEAHRFANNYNELLLRKRMKESLLDDCPGMNKSRKEILFKKYGTIAKMKNASLQELTKLPSIGPKTAQSLLDWLDSH